MADAWASFRREHTRLRAGLERLRSVADSVGRVDLEALRAEVNSVHSFLSHELLPHVAVEERVLYPAIARMEGFGVAARFMSRDHAEVAHFARDVAALRPRLERGELGTAEARELRRILYGLYELLKVHMANEEEVCLPALDRALSAGQIRAVAEGMELFELVEQAAE